MKRKEIEALLRLHPHDPFLKRELERENRRQMYNSMKPMSVEPTINEGWITLLQNRVELNSVGNIRWKKKVYYIKAVHAVGTTRVYDPNTFAKWNDAKLDNGQKPGGWMM